MKKPSVQTEGFFIWFKAARLMRLLYHAQVYRCLGIMKKRQQIDLPDGTDLSSIRTYYRYT